MAHDKDDTRFKFASMLFGYKYFIINAIWFSDLSKLRFSLDVKRLKICIYQYVLVSLQKKSKLYWQIQNNKYR